LLPALTFIIPVTAPVRGISNWNKARAGVVIRPALVHARYSP
jgi:hypothetical protein